jgi:hypothetical protein
VSDADIERVQALVGFRRIEEARDVAIAALERDAESYRLWAVLADVEKRREDWKAAIVAAERSLAIEPTCSSALFTLVPCYEMVGKRKKAREAADTLVSLYPEWPLALTQRAYIYSRWTGKSMPTDASKKIVMQSLERAIELAPEQALLLSDAAGYYANVFEAGKGKLLMDRALELDPTNELIILASKRFTDDEGAIERNLTVLESNPLSVAARADLDARMWSRFSFIVAVPLWVAGFALVVGHLFYDSGAGARWTIALVTLLAYLIGFFSVRNTPRLIPPDILRMTIDQNKLVRPALIVTAIAAAVVLITTLAVVVAPVSRSDAFFAAAQSTLGLVIFAQSLAGAAISFTVARVDLQSMRFADTPAGKNALKRQSANVGGAVLGIFGGIVLLFLSVLTSVHNSLFAVVALAVICVAWTFTEFAVNAYRRSQAYPTMWLAVVLGVIAVGAYLVALWLLAQQLFGAFV